MSWPGEIPAWAIPMDSILLLEQSLNGLQLGMMLFLLASGLTLTFGIMGIINLAHGVTYMLGAYIAATVMAATSSFLLAVLAGMGFAGLLGLMMEFTILRRLYERDHLDQVLATFGIILVANEATKMVFGPQALFMAPPEYLNRSVELTEGLQYPLYRLVIILVGLLVVFGLRHLILNTKLGMLIRAGATHRAMVAAMGVNIARVFTLVFGLGALLAGLAGAMAAPLLAVQVGMGENILILTFVVIIIGGLGSVRGAFAGAMLVGLVDTFGRAILPILLAAILPPETASGLGNSLSDIAIYLLMAVVLVIRPEGLFMIKGKR